MFLAIVTSYMTIKTHLLRFHVLFYLSHNIVYYLYPSLLV